MTEWEDWNEKMNTRRIKDNQMLVGIDRKMEGLRRERDELRGKIEELRVERGNIRSEFHIWLAEHKEREPPKLEGYLKLMKR